MSKASKEDLKRWKKKIKDQGASSRNRRHGGGYTRPLCLEDFKMFEGDE